MKKITMDNLYKPKTIIVKDPKLQRIRNNLRDLWLEFAKIRIRHLKKIENEIDHDKNGNYKGLEQLTGEEIETIRKINKELKEINNLEDKSICKCRRCARSDQDMRFNPRDKFWYYIECYDEMKRWTAKKKTGKSIFFP